MKSSWKNRNKGIRRYNSDMNLRGSRNIFSDRNSDIINPPLGFENESFFNRGKASFDGYVSKNNAVGRLLNNIKEGFSDQEREEKIRDLFFFLVKESKCKGVCNFLESERTFNIDTKNDEGKTALMMAVERVGEEVTNAEISREEYIIENNISEELELEFNIDEDEKKENNIVIAQNEVRKKKEKMAKLLLDKGASINEVDKNNNNVLWYVNNVDNDYIKNLFGDEIGRSITNEEVNILKSVHEEKLDDEELYEESSDTSIDEEDYTYATELERLVCGDNYGIEHLKPFINKEDEEGHTVLSYLMLKNIAERGSSEVMGQIKDLIKAGADMEERDFFGASVLMHAIIAKDEDYIKEILSDEKYAWGFEFQVDNYDNDVLSYAGEFGNSSIFKYLVEEVNVSDDYMLEQAFIKAAKTKNAEVLNYIVNSCPKYDDDILINFDKRDEEGRTTFMLVSQCGNKNTCEYFIKKGINLYDEDVYGCTALTYAVRENNLDAVKCLIENGDLVNHKTHTGVTELMYAVLNNHEEIYEYLVEHGANIDERDNMGRTALMCAAESGSEKAIEYLINHGADTDIKDNEGKTVFNYADIKTNRYLYNKIGGRTKIKDIEETGGRKLFNKLSKIVLDKVEDDKQRKLKKGI